MLKIHSNYPLSKITTLQIGGPAKKFVTVKTEGQLIEVINYAKKNHLEFLVIGGGSNLLVNDKGVDFLVIKNEIRGITTSKVGSLVPSGVEGGSFEVNVKSGTSLQELVNFTISHGFSGLQKLTGIPGTVGGAIFGNAGAYGQTISDNILNVVFLSERSLSTLSSRPKGESKEDLQIITFTKKQCQFNYRDSGFKKNKNTILEVVFHLKKLDPKILKRQADEVLEKRLVKYPPGIKCPGSFFKNIVASEIPENILKNIPAEMIVYGKLPAGSLLEAVGAKGQKSNGIEIASYHGNLFINDGSGTAKNFYDLARKYAKKVKEKFGITLEPEVQLINLPPLLI